MLRLIPAFLVVAAFALTARAENYSHTESLDQTHSFEANGEVTLSNVNGAVIIRTWDRNEVRIEAEKRAKTEEELGLIDLQIDPSPSRLAIKVKLPRRTSGWFSNGGSIRASVALTLTVPATARLRDIETVNGRITITDVRGPVHARSVNGQIEARGLGGDTSLETVNGTIRAELSATTSDQRISTETVNGSATISLPHDASLLVSARCVNGSIDCDFPITLKGSVNRRQLRGTIGGGAASLDAETVNGSIRIRKI
jgi:DUF4097 and DUF4098 domain-containing protein YvlB